jgi:hypothetical protein
MAVLTMVARSLLAVVLGLVVLTVASFAIEWTVDPVLMRLFPKLLPNGISLNHNLLVRIFMLLYTMLCIVGGGYIAAWLARRAEVPHAVVLGVVQMAMTIWVMLQINAGPSWYWIAGIVLTLPAAWYGGLLRARRVRNA